MNNRRNRVVRLGVLCLLTVFTLLRIRSQWAAAVGDPSGDDIPAEGKAVDIDTQGKVPGDPANAVKDMQRLKVLIDVYKRDSGVFPQHTSALYRDIQHNPQKYGVNDINALRDVFMNPDSRYSDDSNARKNPDVVIPYYIYHKRPDGTLVGSPKASGKRDILVFTPLYTHENVRRFRTGRDATKPVGFYVVMWDDGKIEKIPYDKRLYVPVNANTWDFALPGQAGVPANAVTYNQFNSNKSRR